MRQVGARWLKRLVAVAALTFAFAYVPYRVYGSNGFVRYREMMRQHRALADGNENLRQENALLRREIARLKDDLGTIAAVARDELGMVAPGEQVIQIDRSVPASALPLSHLPYDLGGPPPGGAPGR